MIHIRLEGLGFGHGEPLFADLTLSIDGATRLGVVGNNGGGKSSLLACIAGSAEPARGRITRSRGARIGCTEQQVAARFEALTFEAVLTDALPPDEREAQAWRAAVLLDALAVPDALRVRPLAELSGGWRRMALIGRAWIQEPDLLLLDEPTNDLDLANILRLERWLTEDLADVPLVVVSHDRRFLDRCTNQTLFLRPGTSRWFAAAYTRARGLLAASDEAAAGQREREEREADRLKRSAHALRQVAVNHRSDAAVRKSIQIARRADRIEARMTEVHVEARREVRLDSRELASKQVLLLEGATVAAPDGRPLFRIERLAVGQNDRIAVLGPNGSGKTRLLERCAGLIGGQADPADGRAAVSPAVRPGYLDQRLACLPGDGSIRAAVSRVAEVPPPRLTSLLVGAGFPARTHDMPVATLSHGQRTRLALLVLRLEQPNLFILDEPTNHLDIAGQEQLEAELLAQDTACLLVSHDRDFVRRIASRFVLIERRKLVEVDDPDRFYAGLAG